MISNILLSRKLLPVRYLPHTTTNALSPFKAEKNSIASGFSSNLLFYGMNFTTCIDLSLVVTLI